MCQDKFIHLESFIITLYQVLIDVEVTLHLKKGLVIYIHLGNHAF